MNVRLEITISIEILGQLNQLNRDDLPGIVDIEQTRERYPWVDQLFEELSSQASAFLYQYHGRVLFHSIFEDDPDEIFEKAVNDVFTDTQRQINNPSSGSKNPSDT